MELNFFFQHGWGYDQKIWTNWIDYIPGRFFLGERGYFYKAPLLINPVERNSKDPSEKNIIITHSLGLHFIPNASFKHCDFLIVISGFQEFHPRNPNSYAFSLRTIKKMESELSQKNIDVLVKFHQKSIKPLSAFPIHLPQEDPDWKKLISDLHLLNHSKLNVNELQKIPKILLFHGENDSIVSKKKSLELAEKLPNSQMIVFPKDGHALPLSNPQKCLNEILKRLNSNGSSFKKNVIDRFSQSAEIYDRKASLQKKSALDLLDFCTSSGIKGTIFEIGCGTGFVSKKLIKAFPNNPLIISDLSPKMLALCKKNLIPLVEERTNIRFKIIDGEKTQKGSYSMIISGMTFQWFEHLNNSLKQLYSLLEKNGILLFSCLEDKSFPEWKSVLQSCSLPFTGLALPKFQDIKNIVSSLDSDAEITEKTYEVAYSSPLGFFHELKKIGTGFSSSRNRLSYKQWKTLLKKWNMNETKISYNIAYVKLKKKIK